MTKPPAKIETSKYGSCPTCPLCNHAIRDRLTEVFFERKQDINETAEWFDDKFERKFPKTEFKKHFKEHIEPFVTEVAFMKKLEMDKVKQKALSSAKDNNINFNIMKQMTWESMKDVYLTRPKEIKSSADRTEQQKSTKQFTDLAKTYKDQWQMELNFLGMGKTEEEMKNTMKNYMAGLMKQATGALEEFPDAKKKLEEFWNRNSSEDDKPEIVVEEEDDGI